MNKQGTTGNKSHNLYSALESINERIESLALIINNMSDNSGFYAKRPVTQSQIDQYFGRH